ncbi:MAG: acyclic terpene utilization AtuA family protein, partial [Halieaceae bacterium]
ALEQIAENEVRVSGARGRAPGDKYKVCATWRDGFQVKGCIMIGGPRALDKARTAMEAWVKRVRDYYSANDLPDFRQVDMEYFGAEHTYGPHATAEAQNTREIVAKFGLHHDNPAALQFAANEMVYLGTSGVPGFYGLGGGRIRPSGLMRVHSTLIDKSLIPVTVQVGSEKISEKIYQSQSSEAAAKVRMTVTSGESGDDHIAVPLERLAFARSGDKGDNANIGLIARKPEYLPYIYEQVTAQAVEDYFAHLVEGEVERFDLPGFNAFNFFLTEALGGGGAGSVRTDCQGKSLAQQLLSMKLMVPPGLI